jgi:propanol-preferring alcohol dehydrogenase
VSSLSPVYTLREHTNVRPLPAQLISKLHGLINLCKEYISFPVDQLIPIPFGISLSQACCVLCAGVTAFSALRLMDPQLGTWCVIAGAAGGLGHLAIQYAKCFGLRVLAIDGGGVDKERFCMEMGADAYVDFIKEERRLVGKVKFITDGGAHSVLVLSPHQSSYKYFYCLICEK